MRLLPDSEVLAIRLSAFMQKGGWLIAPVGGMALLYLLQDKLVFKPVNTSVCLYRTNAQHWARAVTVSMHDGNRLRGWWLHRKRYREQGFRHQSRPTERQYHGNDGDDSAWPGKRLDLLREAITESFPRWPYFRNL
jgi:hypothetical protein